MDQAHSTDHRCPVHVYAQYFSLAASEHHVYGWGGTGYKCTGQAPSNPKVRQKCLQGFEVLSTSCLMGPIYTHIKRHGNYYFRRFCATMLSICLLIP
eukprot:scaffold33720_cov19-Tisochrysis_lutea.AAC.1